MWWAERPKPRDTAAIRSHYEKAFTETDKDNERVLELRYALRNTTKRDVDIGAIGTTLYVQRRDGSLQDVKNIIGNYKLDEAKVPAGETILYMLHPKIPYEVRKDCKVQTADDPTKGKRVLSTVLTSLSAGALRGECVLYEEFGRDVPRQQLFDPVNRVIGDALENVP